MATKPPALPEAPARVDLIALTAIHRIDASGKAEYLAPGQSFTESPEEAALLVRCEAARAPEAPAAEG
jgi:hypothetical protein